MHPRYIGAGAVASVVAGVLAGIAAAAGAVPLVGALVAVAVPVVGAVVVGVASDIVIRAFSTVAAGMAIRRRSFVRASLRGAARLLPTSRRQEYIEEWRAWLLDMREAGDPWYHRFTELFVILLIAAPQLAPHRASGETKGGRLTMRHAFGITAGGSILTALLTMGWAGAALAAAVIIVLTLAVCWTIADPYRPRRLVLVLTVWRATPTRYDDAGSGQDDVAAIDPGASRPAAPGSMKIAI